MTSWQAEVDSLECMHAVSVNTSVAWWRCNRKVRDCRTEGGGGEGMAKAGTLFLSSSSFLCF